MESDFDPQPMIVDKQIPCRDAGLVFCRSGRDFKITRPVNNCRTMSLN
jgi:hypothetical protein